MSNVLRVHLVHYVTKRTEIVLTVLAVNAIVDSYGADVVLGKIIVSVLTYLVLSLF